MRFFDKDLLKKPEGKAVAIAGVILGFYIVMIIKNIYIDKKETKTTGEYIKELFSKNFGVYQEPVDVYVNYAGLYSGKIQYTVGVGYDLDKSIFKTTTHKVIIKLPYPEVMYIYRNSDLQFSKFNKEKEYIKEIYKYGSLVSKYYSVRTNIFKRTENYTKNVLNNISNSLKIKFKLEFPEEKRNLWNAYSSKRCGISLSIPSDYQHKIKIRNNENILSPYCFLGSSPDGKLKMFVYKAPLNLRIYPKDNKLKQFSLFYPQNEYYMEVINQTEDKRFIRYYYKFKNKVLIVEFKPVDEGIYRYYLPDIMFLSSLIKEKPHRDKEIRDCFGTTKEVWDKSLLGDKQRYIEKYFAFLNSEDIIFDRKNHVLATKTAYKELLPMVKKLAKVAEKHEIKGHLVMAVLNKTGRNLDDTILWVFLDNGKVIAIDREGRRKDFSYQTLIDASLETVDLGHFCLNGEYCFGDGRPVEIVPKEQLKNYKAERELTKIVWFLLNYGFPVLYTEKK